jgi:hypothetical protein
MKPAMIELVTQAFQRGGTVNQIVHGRPTGGGLVDLKLKVVDSTVFYRARRENADFDRFVADAIKNSASIGQKIRHARERTLMHTARVRDETNDYRKIHAMLPPGFPDRDDVVSAVFEDLLTGALKREDVKARLQSYIVAHNRMYPTKFAKFGDSLLISLDEVMFEDGSMTRGDTVGRGLWD